MLTPCRRISPVLGATLRMASVLGDSRPRPAVKTRPGVYSASERSSVIRARASSVSLSTAMDNGTSCRFCARCLAVTTISLRACAEAVALASIVSAASVMGIVFPERFRKSTSNLLAMNALLKGLSLNKFIEGLLVCDPSYSPPTISLYF